MTRAERKELLARIANGLAERQAERNAKRKEALQQQRRYARLRRREQQAVTA